MELLKKLNFKSQKKLHVIDAPDEFLSVLNEIKTKVAVEYKLGGSTIEFALIFVKTIEELTKAAPKVISLLEEEGLLWFAYPKKSSKKYQSDLSRDEGWKTLGNHNYEPVRLIAVDDDWSAVRYKRVEDIKTMTRSTAVSPLGKKRLSEPAKTKKKK